MLQSPPLLVESFSQDTTCDSLHIAELGGTIKLFQPRRGHRVGTDAVLLARYAHAFGLYGTCADFGASTGGVGLMLAALNPGLQVILIENNPNVAELAQANIHINEMETRVRFYLADVTAKGCERSAQGLGPLSVETVVMNPPYDPPQTVRVSPYKDKEKAFVHTDNFDAWARTACDMLRPQGHVVLIQRMRFLAPLLNVLAGRFGGLHIRPVFTKANAPATRVLIRGEKGSRTPLQWLKAWDAKGNEIE
jgi:tRNA1(Val) A37 N6-methylase TrmN6